MLFSSCTINLIDTSFLPISPSVVILGISLVSYFILEQFAFKPFQIPILLFFILCLISFLYAPSILAEKSFALSFFTMLISIILLFNALKSKDDIRLLLVMIISAIVTISIDYIIIGITGGKNLPNYNPDLADSIDNRVNSQLLGNNGFAALSSIGLYLITYFVYFSNEKVDKKYIGILFLIVGAEIITKSRTGFLLMTLFFAYYLVIAKINFFQKLLTISILLFGAFYVFDISYFIEIILERFENIDEDSSNLIRIEILNAAEKSILRYPLFGQGIATFQAYSESFFETRKSMHNTIYEILFSMGYIGLAFFILYTSYPFYKYFMIYRSLSSEEKSLCLIFIVSILSLLIAGIKHEMLYERYYYTIVSAFSFYIYTISINIKTKKYVN